MPTDTFKGIFNPGFDTKIPDGTDGNQSQYGIFFLDGLGLFNRITQAEGNEISYNPETVTRNLIANENPVEFVRRYQLQFSKGILIRKGDPEYEFFNRFRELLPTGANAKLIIMLVDFRKESPGTGGRFDYKAIRFAVTATINTANETDGVLDLSFGQASDIETGIASSENFTETNPHPEFIPSTSIAPTVMRLSAETAILAPGKDRWISVGFEPMGCLEGFEIVRAEGEGHDERICGVEAVRNSVIITGKSPGETKVTVRSVADDGPSKTIAVKVEGASPLGSGGGTPASAKASAARPSTSGAE